jgi:hypothetical protein
MRRGLGQRFKLALCITFAITVQASLLFSFLYVKSSSATWAQQKGKNHLGLWGDQQDKQSLLSVACKEPAVGQCLGILDRHQPFLFVKYSSSPLEVKWNHSIAVVKEDWNQSGCPRIQAEYEEYGAWLNAAASRDPISVAETEPVLSYLVYQDPSDNNRTFRVPIEPIIGLLRHPKAVCLSNVYDDIVRKDWLLLPHSSYFPNLHGRKLFFDLGASLYTGGSGGASQQWFLTEYAARGFEFDHIYAWEAIIHPPDTIFADIPPHMLHKLSYYNVPVERNPDALHNPIRVLKAAAKVSDYVVLKLDIDRPELETALVKQLMADEDAMKLVDEFFFEHHTLGTPMADYWGADTLGDIVDSYELFHALRARGILAHSWV